MEPDVAAYPSEWEADVVLADGGTIHLRPIRPTDDDLLEGLHGRLSPRSVYFRFFSPRPRLTEQEVRRFTHLDYVDRMALVAILGDELVAVARYDRTTDDEAEVAFVVEDAHQGRGIATVLLEHLAAAARERAVTRFYATVLPENRKMIGVFKAAGFDVASSFSDGVVDVRLEIQPTQQALAAIEAREHVSEARSVARILAPRSIAVIGASRERGAIGHEIVRNLIDHGFNGPVYPVNASAPWVASVRTYPSVLDIPDPVDLAVVAVPAADVPAVVEECGRKRVHGLIIVSAGFAEAGTWGADTERAVVELARRSGMRLVGPNCMGVVNTAPDVSMHATFTDVALAPGPVAFSTQSGPLGIAVLQHARRLGMGISTFVSVGNKADVSGNDLLQYWEGDERTDVILLYLESFGNPRKFNRLARRVSRTKPIVAVKSGRTSRGADITVGALLRQTGVIRVDTLEQLFDVARVLVGQPLPAGRRVAIVTNSGGAGLLAADACAGADLEIVESVDLTHVAGPSQYSDALRRLLADDRVDALLVLFVPPVVTRAADVTRAIGATALSSPKTVVATVLTEGLTIEGFRSGDREIPTFVFPEAAAHALGRVAEYAEWRQRPAGTVPELPGADVDGARALVEEALAEPGWAETATGFRLLDAYGVPMARTEVVSSADEAVAAADRLGWPVALKAGGLLRLLKTEAGGLAVDVHDEAELRRAHERMTTMLGDAMGSAVVQEMVAPGLDLVLVVRQDPSFGSLLSLSEDASRILPLTDVDAADLVSRVLAEHAEGEPPGAGVDTAGLEDLLVRVGRLADDLPEIAELRLPLIASAAAAVAIDVRVRVAPWHRPAPQEVRRLR